MWILSNVLLFLSQIFLLGCIRSWASFWKRQFCSSTYGIPESTPRPSRRQTPEYYTDILFFRRIERTRSGPASQLRS